MPKVHFICSHTYTMPDNMHVWLSTLYALTLYMYSAGNGRNWATHRHRIVPRDAQNVSSIFINRNGRTNGRYGTSLVLFAVFACLHFSLHCFSVCRILFQTSAFWHISISVWWSPHWTCSRSTRIYEVSGYVLFPVWCCCLWFFALCQL